VEWFFMALFIATAIAFRSAGAFFALSAAAIAIATATAIANFLFTLHIFD
jgi:hypothetical protein